MEVSTIRRGALGAWLAIALIVAVRLRWQPMPTYGGGAAQYLEHAARVEQLVLWREGDWSSFGEFLVRADLVGFPPMLHFLTGRLGDLTGHAVEQIAWTGLLWHSLGAASLGVVARVLSRRADVAWFAFGLGALLPASHGAAARYYFDLPAAAWLWAAFAALALGRDRKLPVAMALGAVAGCLAFVAGNTKWSMLPYFALGAPGIVLAGWRRWRSRVGAFIAAGGTSLICVLAWIQAGGGSQNETLAMRSSSTGGWDEAVGFLPTPVQATTARMLYELTHPGFEQLAWYPVAIAVSMLSPLLVLVLLPLWWRWLKTRPAWPAALSLVVAPLLFVTYGVAVRDQRFALAPLLGLALVAALGWGELPPPRRRRAAAVVAGVGLLVSLEFHAGPRAFWNAPFPAFRAPAPAQGLEIDGRGVFAGNSFELRGWSRADSTPPSDRAFREALWADIERCGGPSVGLATHVLPNGSIPFLQYRSTLAHLRGSGWPSVGIDAVWWMGPEGEGTPRPPDDYLGNRWIAVPKGRPHVALARGDREGLTDPAWQVVGRHLHPDRPSDDVAVVVYARPPSPCLR